MKKGLIVFFLCAALSAWGNEFYSHVTRAGFTPMRSEVTEIELPAVNGQKFRLSSWRGRWILLNFWATWCGPCRYEMPLLEKVSSNFSSLKVLGVAVDGKEKSAVKKFLKQNEISFQNVLDINGVAANAYQASSIPVVYLIAPDWKIVGRLQGAQDWQAVEVEHALKALMKFKKTPEELPKSGGEELEPPVVEIKKIERTIKAGELFVIEAMVTWNGDSYDYQLRPPRLTLPKDVWQGEVSSESSSYQDGAALRYQFPLRIDKAGKYSIGPIEVTYGQKKLKAMGATIEVDVVGGFTWWPYFMVLFLVGIFSFIWKKSRTHQKKNEENVDEIAIKIKQLQTNKLNYSSRDYQIELLKICQTLDKNESDLIGIRIEKILYGGELLSLEETNYFEKRLNKYVSVEDE